MTTTSQLKLLYEGSVKRVWQSPLDPNLLWFEFTDDYSVFDWGKMPDTIENKGRALTIFGAYFFEKLGAAKTWQELPSSPHLQTLDRKWLEALFAGRTFQTLQEKGCRNHYREVTCATGERVSLSRVAQGAEATYLEVEKAEVLRPAPAVVLNQNVFEYPRSEQSTVERRLVPLEVVFRFGMPSGSSLLSRLEADPNYARVLGLSATPKENEFFEHPVIELYTKLEPKDRLLSVQEALLISGLSSSQMQELVDLSYSISLALLVLFAERDIQLWDGKVEFILGKDGIALADSIGPDELRLLYKNCHLSKEMVRRVYRGTKWESSLKEAQSLARTRATLDWKRICSQELGQSPERLQPEIKKVIDNLYPVIVNHLVAQPLFSGQPSLDDFVDAARDQKLAEK